MEEFEQMLQEAQDALEKGSWKTAVAIASEARNIRPEHLEPVLLHAMALMDGGLFEDALDQLDHAEALAPDNPRVVTARGICMFELCKFDSARGVLELALELDNRMAQAHHYMGLLLEREGDWLAADESLVRACELQPEMFSLPVTMDDEEFRSLVEESVMEMSPGAIRLLEKITIELELLPAERDLMRYSPPLSPQILGLGVKGAGGRLRSIVLFQRNLQRIALDKKDLEAQIRATILHELKSQETQD